MEVLYPTYLEICTQNPWQLSWKETLLHSLPLCGVPAMIQTCKSNREIRADVAAILPKSLPSPRVYKHPERDGAMVTIPISPPAPTDPLLGRVSPILVKKSNRYVMAVVNVVGSLFLTGTFLCLKALGEI